MQRLSMAALGAVFIAVGTTGTAPATAALLDFSFTTERGGTGSFTLDTDIPPVPGAQFGLGPTGFSYPNAVSKFSFSAPYIDPTLSSVIADYNVAPSFPLTPDGREVFSGVSFPSGCSRAITSCSVNVAISYSGNVSDSPPVLSDDPLSYLRGLGVEVFDPTQPIRDNITNFQAVPEPGSVLGTLAFGIGGALLLMKRKMNRNRAAIKP